MKRIPSTLIAHTFNNKSFFFRYNRNCMFDIWKFSNSNGRCNTTTEWIYRHTPKTKQTKNTKIMFTILQKKSIKWKTTQGKLFIEDIFRVGKFTATNQKKRLFKTLIWCELTMQHQRTAFSAIFFSSHLYHRHSHINKYIIWTRYPKLVFTHWIYDLKIEIN